MTRLHLIYAHFKLARQNLDSQNASAPIKDILLVCLKAFALRSLLLDSQTLYECGFFAKGSGRQVDLAYRESLKQMRPQMLPLVESFSKAGDTKFVPSTIGNEYGDIYEMQLDTARNSKLNKGIVPEFFETHMKPVMTMHKSPAPKL